MIVYRRIKAYISVLDLRQVTGQKNIANPLRKPRKNPRNRHSGADFKPPLGAAIKSCGAEHKWKKCIRFKYKSTGRGHLKAHQLLSRIFKEQPNLFYHWQLGLRPAVG